MLPVIIRMAVVPKRACRLYREYVQGIESGRELRIDPGHAERGSGLRGQNVDLIETQRRKLSAAIILILYKASF